MTNTHTEALQAAAKIVTRLPKSKFIQVRLLCRCAWTRENPEKTPAAWGC
jgi:hypothetical protein